MVVTLRATARQSVPATLESVEHGRLGLFLCVTIVAWGSCALVAKAQSPLLSNGGDLPTQRWIPIPQGQQASFSAQAELLQQLRDFVVGKESNTPLPQLSEAQLQQIEQAFQDWKSQLGETKLPNLDSIPREWIEDALADPLARMQAQRLLEQYAQARNLPPPSSQPTRPGQDAIPLPQSNSLRQPEPNNEPNNEPDNSSTASNHPSRFKLADDQADLATRLAKDAERMQALRDLFEKLQETQTPLAPSVSPPQNPSRNPLANRTDSGPSTTGTRARNDRPTASNGNVGAREKLSQPISSSNMPLGNSIRRQTNSAASSKERITATNKDTSSVSKPNRSDNTANPTDSTSEPFSNPSSFLGSDNSHNLSSEAGPADPWSEFTPKEIPGAKNLPPLDVPRAQPAIPKNSRSGSKPAESGRGVELDVKSQVERHGLGETLRRIVERTINEEATKGERTALAPSEKSAASTSWWSNPPQPSETMAGESIRNSGSSREWTQDAVRAAVAKAQSLTQGHEKAVKDSQFTKALASVWKAISTVPDNASVGNTSRGNTSTDATNNSPRIAFHWGSYGWQVLLLSISLAGLLLFLARRRLHLASSAKTVDGRWVKEMLEVGIRTRADVVRAFHYFVIRRPQPASLWWTHRYVANRLAESSPNLRNAIEDLTSVYEQARYLPPEVELSAEQFERAQTALQTCQPCSL